MGMLSLKRLMARQRQREWRRRRQKAQKPRGKPPSLFDPLGYRSIYLCLPHQTLHSKYLLKLCVSAVQDPPPPPLFYYLFTRNSVKTVFPAVKDLLISVLFITILDLQQMDRLLLKERVIIINVAKD